MTAPLPHRSICIATFTINITEEFCPPLLLRHPKQWFLWDLHRRDFHLKTRSFSITLFIYFFFFWRINSDEEPKSPAVFFPCGIGISLWNQRRLRNIIERIARRNRPTWGYDVFAAALKTRMTTEKWICFLFPPAPRSPKMPLSFNTFFLPRVAEDLKKQLSLYVECHRSAIFPYAAG